MDQSSKSRDTAVRHLRLLYRSLELRQAEPDNRHRDDRAGPSVQASESLSSDPTRRGDYPSSRSVIAGSSRAARPAGIKPASIPMDAMAAHAMTNATGSSGETPNSSAFAKRVSANAPADPMTKPISTRFEASRRTCPTTSEDRAPSAIRMPISRRR